MFSPNNNLILFQSVYSTCIDYVFHAFVVFRAIIYNAVCIFRPLQARAPQFVAVAGNIAYRTRMVCLTASSVSNTALLLPTASNRSAAAMESPTRVCVTSSAQRATMARALAWRIWEAVEVCDV